MAEFTQNLNLEKPVGGENFRRQVINGNMDKIDEALGERVKQSDFDAHKADYTLQVPYAGATTNVGNAYSIASPTIAALAAGMAIAVKINADSTGVSTLNWYSKGAKGIKKANGTDVTNLKANGIYTLRYDGTNFILQGEGASGNAIASDLLSGKTATTDAGEITGTLALTGTATAADVANGKTFYNTDPKAIITGTRNSKRYATGSGSGLGVNTALVVSGIAFQPRTVIIYGKYSYLEATLAYTAEIGAYSVFQTQGYSRANADGTAGNMYVFNVGFAVTANGFSMTNFNDGRDNYNWIAFE